MKLKVLYRSATVVAVLLCSMNGLFAGGPVPGNDLICSATALPLDGSCATSQTNSWSTPGYIGGCVASGVNSVWYTFTLNGSNDMLDVTLTVPGGLGAPSLGNGNNVEMFLMNGTCAVASGVLTECDVASATFTFGTSNSPLTVGGTYWLQVSTAQDDSGNFDICGTESVAPVGSITGPEQDCGGAFPVCSTDNDTIVGSYAGIGSGQDVNTGSCLLSGENNSVWYIFTIQPGGGGSFGFDLVTSKDYDFALYDITTIGCGGIPTVTTPLRCNYSANPINTGLTVPGSTKGANLAETSMGTPTMNGVSNVAPGETYALVIDNWSGDNSGFVIDWLGTSTIVDATTPTFSTIVPSCSANTILLTMAEEIQCLTVVTGDFKLYNVTTSTYVTSKISSVAGFGCPITDGALTDEIQITHDGTLTTGEYRLELITTPVLADKCGNVIANTETISFFYLEDNITLTSNVSSICSPLDPVNLNAGGIDGTPSISTYTFTPTVGPVTNTTNGQITVNPTTTTIYTVSVTYGGCTRTASVNITMENNVVLNVDPMDPQICSDADPASMTASVSGGTAPYTYSWDTSPVQTNATATGLTVAGGPTYTVTVTTGSGCAGGSISSTVGLASAGALGNCFVYYVTTGGSGSNDGLTPVTPTTIDSALARSLCTSSIIKVATGTYTLSDAQTVNSYVTLEGGYNSGFTRKNSSQTASTATRFVRNNTPDSSSPYTCTAFSIAAGAVGFRFQDIRIDMPGASGVTGHDFGTGVTNYAVFIPAGSSGYSFVRCYIDAGVGAAGF